MKLGEQLKEKRIEQRLGLKDIERITRIRAKYLLAIEKGEFDQLPQGTYPKAFIRSYCQALDLNNEPFLKEYDLFFEIHKHESPSEEKSFFRPRKQGRDTLIYGKKAFPYAWAAVLVVIVIFYFLIIRPLWSAKAPGGTAAGSSPAATTQTGTQAGRFLLKVSPPGAWLKITVDDKVMFEGIGGSNENTDFSFKGGQMTVRTGNAGVVYVASDGNAYEALGKNEEVVERSFGREKED